MNLRTMCWVLGIMTGLSACQDAAGNESALHAKAGHVPSQQSVQEAGREGHQDAPAARRHKPSESAQIDPTVLKAELGKEFQLPIHRVVAIVDEDLSLTFEEVLEDSRCPQGVDCVWSGQAVIRLMAEEGGEARSLQLKLRAGSPETAGTRVGAYLLQFIQLAPYPRAEQNIPPTDYVATLLVKKPEQE